MKYVIEVKPVLLVMCVVFKHLIFEHFTCPYYRIQYNKYFISYL